MNIIEELQEYFKNTPLEKIESDWDKSAIYNNVGPTVEEYFKSLDKPTYIMSIDTYDKESLAYCLARRIGDDTEILLIKTSTDEEEFHKEVDNLVKYFNATFIQEEN